MAEMSHRSFPFLPTTLLLRHRFDCETKMSHITCPILLGHGRKDDLVPVTMLDRLAAAATKAPVMKFIVDDAGHNDFYAVGQDQIFEAMGRFLPSHPRVLRRPPPASYPKARVPDGVGVPAASGRILGIGVTFFFVAVDRFEE